MKRWQQDYQLPSALRTARADTITLVPASLLPHKARYQAIARHLPRGDVLIVLPETDCPERQLLETTARLFAAKGRHVTTLPSTAIAVP
jgi:hypothetical protein